MRKSLSAISTVRAIADFFSDFLTYGRRFRKDPPTLVYFFNKINML